MSLPTTEHLLALLQLLAPGIIITAIHARAATGIAPKLKDRILEFAIVSVVYSAIAMPLFSYNSGPQFQPALWNILYSIVTPAVIGIILAYVRAYKLTYKAAKCIKLPIAHHLPTAWDYTFESVPAGTFLLVTMSDGTQIAGKMGENSFASSSETERDILIDEVWDVPKEGPWVPTDPTRSILICDKNIKFVEIL